MDVVFESFGAMLAACVGFITYERMNRFYRLLYEQLMIWLVLYIVSYVVTDFQRSFWLGQNNHWVFNLNILIETTFLLLSARSYFEKVIAKKIILFSCIFFLFISLILHSVNNFFIFNESIYVIESILIVIIYTFILFRCFYETFTIEVKSPEIWASIGLILYFGCNLPYFSLFNYLNTHYLSMSEILQDRITDVLSNIRYLLLAVGFWVITRKASFYLQT
jgi:hypothetical protein